MLWLAIGAVVVAIPFGYAISHAQPDWGQTVGWFGGWLAAAVVLEMTGAFIYAFVHAV